MSVLGSKPKTGTCQRPGCGNPAKPRRVYCSWPCRAQDFSARSMGVPKQPWKPREATCASCGQTFKREWPSEIGRTCSRKCMGQLKREQMAEDRLEDLTSKGINEMTPLEAYSWGYKNGYGRRRDFEKRRAAR